MFENTTVWFQYGIKPLSELFDLKVPHYADTVYTEWGKCKVTMFFLHFSISDFFFYYYLQFFFDRTLTFSALKIYKEEMSAALTM